MVRALIVIALVICVWLPCGCGKSHPNDSRPASDCHAIILQDKLPAGWVLYPTAKMPCSDKMPWWNANPLHLRRPETQQVDIEGKPTSASDFWAALYVKEHHEVAIFCMAYPDSGTASAEYEVILKSHSAQSGLLGYCRDRPNAIILLSIAPDCPDRDFFVRHFHAVADERLSATTTSGPN